LFVKSGIEKDKLTELILYDYDLPTDEANKRYLRNQVTDLIKLHEEKFSYALAEETRNMLRNLILQMSFDKLCVRKDLEKIGRQ
jgi:hypothetical protein